MATLGALPRSEPIGGASFETVDMKFEVVVIPVADVDRSKEFYTKLGWRLDADFPFDNGFRVVQPADVAALAVHIMTNTALTGATYDVDGGQQFVAA